MTTKQEKFYRSILLEIYNSGIDINFNGFKLNSLKFKEGELKEKIKVYHLFFKSLGSFPKDKIWGELCNREFNLFLESIRTILSENKYVLRVDDVEFNRVIEESKKVLDFNNFLKK